MPRWRRRLLKRRRERENAIERIRARRRQAELELEATIERLRLIDWAAIARALLDLPQAATEVGKAIDRQQRDLMRAELCNGMLEGYVTPTPELAELLRQLGT